VRECVADAQDAIDDACSGDAIDDAILKRHYIDIRHLEIQLHLICTFLYLLLHLKCAIRAYLSPRDEEESSGRAKGAI